MVIINLNSGLGNQLFQYACGRRIAAEFNVPLKLDITWFDKNPTRKYVLKYFNIIEHFATVAEIADVKQKGYLKEENHQFRPDFLKIPSDVYVEGYWQSEQYFKDIEGIIREEFSLRYESNEPNKRMAEMIKNCEAVSLHIRRGDFQSSPNFQVCPLDYYYQAVKTITDHVPRPFFFVFSDDWRWTQKNLRLRYPTIYVTLNDEKHCYEDLHLMSLCKYHINANSTFSWWGAWLSKHQNQIVCTPRNWLKIDDRLPEWYHHLLPLSWNKL